jgi:hypothetical protein
MAFKTGHGAFHNRGGPAKSAAITQALISELNAIDPFTKVTKMRMLIVRLVEMATCDKPDLGAIKEIYDRVEGKARQPVDVTNDGETTGRSAAVSVLAQFLDEALGREPARTDEKPMPN